MAEKIELSTLEMEIAQVQNASLQQWFELWLASIPVLLHRLLEEDNAGKAKLERDATFANYNKEDNLDSLVQTTVQQARDMITSLQNVLGTSKPIQMVEWQDCLQQFVYIQRWTWHKILWWLHDPYIHIWSVLSVPLQVAHRQWVRFLRYKYEKLCASHLGVVASDGEVEDSQVKRKKWVAWQYLRAQGHIRESIQETHLLDTGESRLVQAAGEGWPILDFSCLLYLYLCDSPTDRSTLAHATLLATPLYRAAQNGHKHLVRCLIEEGANVSIRTADVTPLYIASQIGHADCVQLLLQAGADPNDGGMLDSIALSPLYASVQNDHPDCLKLLLDAGADCNVIVGGMYNPLFTAMCANHVECLEMLIQAGASWGHLVPSNLN